MRSTHPGYGWEHNRGYPTPEHIRALDTHGLTPLHRRSFGQVRERLALAAQGRLPGRNRGAESFGPHHHRLSPFAAARLNILCLAPNGLASFFRLNRGTWLAAP